MKKQHIALFLWFAVLCIKVNSQSTDTIYHQPRLVIGIVVDQMRYDYLLRFRKDFSDRGFNKLVQEGHSYTNTHYNYKPTYTGPGHASIFTGTTPSQHGIVANSWYDRKENKMVYCVEDPNNPVQMSPLRLEAQTIADVVKIATVQRGKTIGIALKDRGAILPVGRSADAAYWFDSKKGYWVTGEYYNGNHDVLKAFNEKDFLKEYLPDNWSLLRPLEDYKESLPDKNEFEAPFYKGGATSFPYDLKDLHEEIGADVFKRTPFGNTMTLDFAKNIIIKEALGKDDDLDFLSISLSATDYIGHQFGVDSKEVQDCYLRLDLDLADFIDELERQIGKDNFLLFLTADHGAGSTPKYLKQLGQNAGYLNRSVIEAYTDSILDVNYGDEDWVERFVNLNFYFNASLLNKYKIDQNELFDLLNQPLSDLEGIKKIWSPGMNRTYETYDKMIFNGYRDERSGDLILLEESNWVSYSNTGSTHGSPYTYDSHVPFLIYGSNIDQGLIFSEQMDITQFAAKICRFIDIALPDNAEK